MQPLPQEPLRALLLRDEARDTSDGNVLLLAVFSVEFRIHIDLCFRDGAEIILGSDLKEIQHGNGGIQITQDLRVFTGIFLHGLQRLKRSAQIVIQRVRKLVDVAVGYEEF